LHVVRPRDAVAADRALPARCSQGGIVPRVATIEAIRALKVVRLRGEPANVLLHPRLRCEEAALLAARLGCRLIWNGMRVRLIRDDRALGHAAHI
jgi:hypothetical protein